LEGRPDTLREYSMAVLEICDPEVIAITGTSQHTIIRFSGNPNDVVIGTVFRLTSEELARADLYEVSEYRRVAVQLCSGTNAFVYVASRS
jgi:gamma-glutamyl AIG2-like cyclotransferase